MRRYLSVLYILLSVACGVVRAHDFMITQNGQKIYFNISDERKLTVEVTYGGSITAKDVVKPAGDITIPKKVRHNNKTYTVKAVGAKAFANAPGLTAITLPSGLSEIHDFAFENCTGLKSVVFPANQVKFGQGTFFKCTSIETVSFGSDWKQIDFTIFRWTDKLVEITVPAKVERMYNINRLKGLKRVTVDNNNTRYSASEGIVYTKDGRVLLACPLGYEGQLKVADGVTTVKAGAMIGCKGLTSVELPASLAVMSFREFSKMQALQSVTFRAEKPIVTAKDKDGEHFVIQLPNGGVNIFVPKSGLKDYKNAIVSKDGEYMENSPKAVVPYAVKATELANAKNFTGVKTLK